MRRYLALLAALALATNLTASPAFADTHPQRLVPGQTVTLPLRGGGVLTLTTTATRRIPLGRVTNDPSSYIETTATFYTGFGTIAATYKLHTDWYWDGTNITQVSPYDTPTAIAPGYSFAWHNTSWRWVVQPTNAESRGAAELDSWLWTPNGSILVWYCQFHLLHEVDGSGGAYGQYGTDSGC